MEICILGAFFLPREASNKGSGETAPREKRCLGHAAQTSLTVYPKVCSHNKSQLPPEEIFQHTGMAED